MLCLIDFVAGRRRFYNLSMGLCIPASIHCRKTKLECICSVGTSKESLLILSRLSDFVTCSERFNIKSEGSISQLWSTVKRLNFVYMFIRHSYTQIVNNVTFE